MESLNQVIAFFLIIVLTSLTSILAVLSYYRNSLKFIAVLTGLADLIYIIELLGTRIEYFEVIHYIVNLPCILSIMPLIYLYVKNLSQKVDIYKISNIVHLFPTIIFAIANSIIFFDNNLKTGNIQNYIQRILDYQIPVYKIILIIFWDVFCKIQIVIYLFLLIKESYKHRRILSKEYSDFYRRTLNWLRYLLYFVAACSILFFGIWYSATISDNIKEIIFKGVYFSFLLMLGYHTIRQKELFNNINGNYVADTNPSADKKSALVLDEATKTKLKRKLTDLMKKEKLFTKQGISLSDLSEHLQTNKNTVTQIINNEIGASFYKYINSLRIEEACKYLSGDENNNLSIEGIAFKVGFRSKTSFNNSFKELKGITPSQFKTINKG